MSSLIRLRRDTAANWMSINPTLALGEPGVETDTGLMKVGDGSSAWNSLDYTAATGPQGAKGDKGDTGEFADADDLIATSTTSLTIGTGEQTLTIESGKKFSPGMVVIIAQTSNAAVNYMSGIVTSLSGTTLVVEVSSASGSGTHTDWTITFASGVGTGNGGVITVTSLSDLTGNLDFPGTLRLTTDITLTDDITIDNPDLIIDGDGFQIDSAQKCIFIDSINEITGVVFELVAISLHSTASRAKFHGNTFQGLGIICCADLGWTKAAADALSNVVITNNQFVGVRVRDFFVDRAGSEFDNLNYGQWTGGCLYGGPLLICGNGFTIENNYIECNDRADLKDNSDVIPAWAGGGTYYGQGKAFVYAGYNHSIQHNIMNSLGYAKVGIIGLTGTEYGSSCYGNIVANNTVTDCIAEYYGFEGFSVSDLIVTSVTAGTNTVVGTLQNTAVNTADMTECFIVPISGNGIDSYRRISTYTDSSGTVTIVLADPSAENGWLDLDNLSADDRIAVTRLFYNNLFYNNISLSSEEVATVNSFYSNCGISIFGSCINNTIQNCRFENLAAPISAQAIRIGGVAGELGAWGRYMPMIGMIITGNTVNNFNWFTGVKGYTNKSGDTSLEPIIYAVNCVFSNNVISNDWTTTEWSYSGMSPNMQDTLFYFNKNLTLTGNIISGAINYDDTTYRAGKLVHKATNGEMSYDANYGTLSVTDGTSPTVAENSAYAVRTLNKNIMAEFASIDTTYSIEMRATSRSSGAGSLNNRVLLYQSGFTPDMDAVSLPSYAVFIRGGTAASPANTGVGPAGSYRFGIRANGYNCDMIAAMVLEVTDNGSTPEAILKFTVPDGSTTVSENNGNVNVTPLTITKSGIKFSDGSTQTTAALTYSLPYVSKNSAGPTLEVRKNNFLGSSTSGTITLPASPADGDPIVITNNSGGSKTIARGSTHTILGEGNWNNTTWAVPDNTAVTMVFMGSVYNYWCVIGTSKVSSGLATQSDVLGVLDDESASALTLRAATDTDDKIIVQDTDGNTQFYVKGNGEIGLYDATNTQVGKWDSTNKRLGLGTTSPATVIHSLVDGSVNTITQTVYNSTVRSESQRYNGSVASPSIIANADVINYRQFKAYVQDSATPTYSLKEKARETVVVNGTVGTDVAPMDIFWSTTNTTGAPVERLRILSDGPIKIIGGSGSPPTAGAGYRGALYVQQGGAGVADTLQVCLKSSSDTYSWKTISTG